jgi:hypothetical protein
MALGDGAVTMRVSDVMFVLERDAPGSSEVMASLVDRVVHHREVRTALSRDVVVLRSACTGSDTRRRTQATRGPVVTTRRIHVPREPRHRDSRRPDGRHEAASALTEQLVRPLVLLAREERVESRTKQ